MKRLHRLSAVRSVLQGAVRTGGLGLFAGIGLTGALELGPFVPVALGFLGALLGGGYAVARYLRFTYDLSGGTLSVASGVFDRQDREIPVGRVQNVDLERDVVHRLLGLAVVKFETAGGSGTEAVLDAVAVDEARRLQEAVAAQRAAGGESAGPDGTESATDADAGDAVPNSPGSGAGSPPSERAGHEQPTRETVYELSVRDLLVLGAVSIRPGAPVLAVVGTPFVGDFAWRALSAGTTLLGGPALDSMADLARVGPEQLPVVAGVALVEFLAASWLLSAVVTVVTYYGFRLERVGEDLRYERGLLGRYGGSIPVGKIQTVTVRENALMRRFGYAALAVETAGYGPGTSDDASNVAVPLDDRALVRDRAASLAGVAPGAVERPTVERPPRRAARRYAARFALVPVVAALGLLAANRFLAASIPWYLALAGLVLAPVAGALRWHNQGHAVVDGGFVARSGFWVRHTRVVPYYRVQTVIDRRSAFQRFRDLATVTADTASTASLVGGDATAYDVGESTATALHRTLRDRLAADVARIRRGDLDPTAGRFEAVAGGHEEADDAAAGDETEAGERADDENGALGDREDGNGNGDLGDREDGNGNGALGDREDGDEAGDA